MKKNIYILLVVMFLFTSCESLLRKKGTTKIRKSEENNAPVPEFKKIESFVRTSYNPINIDEIRRETYVAESPHLDITIKDLILKGKVRIGMYKEDVYASLGQSENKIQYTTEFGLKEEWIYGKYIYHFENGVLKHITAS